LEAVALLANFIARREEKQILLPPGGIRMICPFAAGAERSVAKNLLLDAAYGRVVILSIIAIYNIRLFNS
jgi:hypothetical protein